MGYPVAYRGGRGPQRGPRAIPWDGGPPVNPGPYMAAGVMAWAFGQLAIQLQGWNGGSTYIQSPANYGWTAVLLCNRPMQRLPASGFLNCSLQVVGKASWEAHPAQNPMTATQLYYWQNTATFNVALQRYQNCPPAAHYTRGTGRPFSYAASWPARPGVLLGGPISAAVKEAAGMWDAGYSAPALPVPGRLPGFDQLDNRWAIWIGSTPGAVPKPIDRVPDMPRPVARAVPAYGMQEVKFNANTRAGRAFFAMYAMFNLLGDAQGFTRALWFSLPRERRGQSMRFRNMVSDIWKHGEHIDPLLGAANIAKWKFLDTLYGGTQAAMFKAISAGYGYALARVWATLESEINATVSFQRQRLERDQGSQRGG